MTITKELLDRMYGEVFDLGTFLSVDPCGAVHELARHTSRQMDVEVGALMTAMISWGNRKVICPTARRMLGEVMCWRPAEFILSGRFEDSYAEARGGCVYRTLNVDAFKAVCRRLREALAGRETMEQVFEGMPTRDVVATLCSWLSDARVGTMDRSACKRVCMFVRWMTRREAPDLGLWRGRSQADLYAVMDTHVLQLTQGMLRNKRPTWRACEELTAIFKAWDPADPLKYDVALMTLADWMKNK